VTAYRQNAWRPPETTPAPRLTRCERLLEWCWVTLVQPLLCREGYHRLHQHTYALGWCRACHRPLVWKRATESLRPNGTLVAPDGWHEISVTQWERLHEISVACGMDERCTERMRAGVN